MTCPRCTMLLGLIAAALIAQEPWPTSGPAFTSGMRSVCVPGLELHYTRNVSEAEAERVATWLVQAGITNQFPGAMLFDHTDTGARLDVTAAESTINDEHTIRRTRHLVTTLSEDMLSGTQVEVRLRDPSGQCMMTIEPAGEGPFFYN